MAYATDQVFSALKSARENQAISQRELSAKTGIPQAQISRLEGGAVDIRLSSFVALARALDLEIVLVPRSAMPAVESIVRQTQRRAPPRVVPAAVAHLVRALQGVRPGAVPTALWEQTLGHVRMLERLQPDADQLAAIVAFGRFLQRAAATDIDPAAFVAHAKAIEQIRNKLAQPGPAARPQVPAYALDDEDDDA
jgi:transcriptional regulator with XRE-family HTH domain